VGLFAIHRRKNTDISSLKPLLLVLALAERGNEAVPHAKKRRTVASGKPISEENSRQFAGEEPLAGLTVRADEIAHKSFKQKRNSLFSFYGIAVAQPFKEARRQN